MRLQFGLPTGDNRVVFNARPVTGGRRYSCELEHGYIFSLLTHRSAAVSEVEIAFYSYQQNQVLHSVSMPWVDMKWGMDVFSVKFDKIPLSVGLYEVLVKVQTPEGDMFVQTSDDHNGWLVQNVPPQKTKPFLVYSRLYPGCKWIEGGIIYHIFIDRFFRGESTPVAEDCFLCDDWDHGIPQYPAYPGAPLANNMFFGGNLSGIICKLPYLASLGVTCLYLSPIAKAASNHKYDVGNYMEIDPSFGDEETFKKLISNAHNLGIRIILDGVFNHTGANSLYFNKFGKYPTLGAYQSKDSPYHDWYIFREFPDSYESWWGIEILPKLNLKNPQLRDYFLSENGVIAHYAKLGVDGFRLDVADELDDDFISAIKHRLSTFGKDKILYGEVWEDASSKIAYGKLKHYFWGEQLDGVMNYPIRTGLIRYFRYGEISPLLYAIETVMRNAPKAVADAQMNFLGTHDTERILSALADISFDGMTNDQIADFRMTEEQRSVALKRLQLALLCISTLPGITTLYYGDETGMEGYKDPFNRLPYPWNNSDEDLRKFTKELFSMRRGQAVYKRGEIKIHRLDQEQFVFSRLATKYAYITIVNRGENCLHFHSDSAANIIFPAKKAGQNFKVPPMSGIVIKVDKNADCHLYSVRMPESVN